MKRTFLRPDDAYAKIKAGQMSDELLVDAGRVYCYWNDKMEKAAIASIRQQLPGFEFGRLPDDCTVFAHWQNGPDRYDFIDRPYRYDRTKPLSMQETLVHVLDCWTKITKKSKDAPARQPTDVAALLESLTHGDLRHNFHHAADGFRDAEYPPFVQMFEDNPELHYDCVQHCRHRRYPALKS